MKNTASSAGSSALFVLLIIFLLFCFMIIGGMGGAIVTGNCDTNASAGEPGSCFSQGEKWTQETLGLNDYDNMGEWWADRP